MLAEHPEAVAVREVGTFVGGKIRYKVLLKPNGRKVVGYGQRESWAWAEACRALGLWQVRKQKAKMEPIVLDALKSLVNRARFERRARLSTIREETIAAGFSAEVVDEAIKFWADYERRKSVPS
ncbi:hypothetical protein [Burkholderia cepacia]|uniref:hypothetical protein n=1 Tax=Burkholderia cepacia TaxID=292 RepID=UPI002AB6E490|nr:hypothetical protein [Burkholderia cepacia]